MEKYGLTGQKHTNNMTSTDGCGFNILHNINFLL